jgi:large repetitive protein
MKTLLLLIACSLFLVRAGEAATAHYVDLNWGASPSPGIVNYLVYRSLTTGGPYTNIGQTAATVLTYHDATVLAGTTYYYVVTAKDANNESAKSNEAKAVVPADPVPPNPPVNLTVTAQ